MLQILERDSHQVLVRVQEPTNRPQVLPSTLEQLIANRLNELPSEEREVVHCLAVAGGPLHADDLVKLGRVTEAEPIARLCARGMWLGMVCSRSCRARSLVSASARKLRDAVNHKAGREIM
jgi:predicted ATPase